MITKTDIDKLLQETDWIYSDDVKNAITNLETFSSYRKLLRLFRVTMDDSGVESSALPTKPTIVWDMDKLA
tara:strand:+ start:1901 stop:2113 length:213 start_codon:yes stop_codon:yes gene_type:complete